MFTLVSIPPKRMFIFIFACDVREYAVSADFPGTLVHVLRGNRNEGRRNKSRGVYKPHI
jgi:hypothetical protein